MNILDSNSLLLTQKALDFTWQKQRIIMDNISNVETPGYKARYATFEDELRRKISSLSGKSSLNTKNDILNANMRIHYTNNESSKADGNNVDVISENIELTRTAYQYNYLTSLANDELTRLSLAIKG